MEKLYNLRPMSYSGINTAVDYVVDKLTLSHSEQPKLHSVFAVLSTLGLKGKRTLVKMSAPYKKG